MKRQFVVIRGGLLSVLVLTATACAYLAPQKAAPTEVRVVITPFLSLTAFSVADKEGYFAEQNIQIKQVALQRSADALPALVQGSIDVLPAGIGVGMFNTMARGAAIRIVAPGTYLPANACPATTLVARRALVEQGGLN